VVLQKTVIVAHRCHQRVETNQAEPHDELQGAQGTDPLSQKHAEDMSEFGVDQSDVPPENRVCIAVDPHAHTLDIQRNETTVIGYGYCLPTRGSRRTSSGTLRDLFELHTSQQIIPYKLGMIRHNHVEDCVPS